MLASQMGKNGLTGNIRVARKYEIGRRWTHAEIERRQRSRQVGTIVDDRLASGRQPSGITNRRRSPA